MKKTIILTCFISLGLVGCTGPGAPSDQPGNPAWVQKIIDNKQADNISKCSYQNKTSYYAISPCCDNYNYLYDENNNVICAPDGGLTGRGDEKCPDFSKKDCELIWQK